jgi:hypothetical protein
MSSPLFPTGSATSTLSYKFMAHVDVDPDTGCWLWNGRLDTSGYGQFKRRQAHIVAYEAIFGPVPRGLVLDHVVCRTRRCVNGRHTRAVTKAVNNIENSLGPSAVNAVKVACVRGHPFDAENTGRDLNGYRVCRECRREATRRWRSRKAGVIHE